MNVRRLFIAAAFSLAAFGVANAQEHGTPAEAQAMAEAAAAYVAEVGQETAFEAFTTSDDWKDRDLYVFVVGLDGITAAHGADPTRVGLDQRDLTDVNGFHFIQAMLGIETAGWVDYIWPDPLTGQNEPKTSYIIRIGDFVLGVGAYRLTE